MAILAATEKLYIERVSDGQYRTLPNDGSAPWVEQVIGESKSAATCLPCGVHLKALRATTFTLNICQLCGRGFATRHAPPRQYHQNGAHA